MKALKIDCDICKNEIELIRFKYPSDIKKWEDKYTQTRLDIIFTTEQTEGRAVEPHISHDAIDLCEKCKTRRSTGESIFASGAQGNNNYYFKTK